MSNQFDISKPVFDPLSLRAVRGDAIVQYDATNQSEPLRIVLFALFGLTLLSAPFLVESVGYEPMNTPATIASVILATASGGLFVRECTRRARQLTRIEKELNTEGLPIRLPTNPFSEIPFSKAFTLKSLRAAKQPPRIIAICGNQSKLTEILRSLSIYRHRLSQASVFVVPVSTDGSTAKDWQVSNNKLYKSWLADSSQPQVWLDYFRALTDEETNDDFDFRWFGLNANGRSFGSGDGEMRIIQLMGQYVIVRIYDWIYAVLNVHFFLVSVAHRDYRLLYSCYHLPHFFASIVFNGLFLFLVTLWKNIIFLDFFGRQTSWMSRMMIRQKHLIPTQQLLKKISWKVSKHFTAL